MRDRFIYVRGHRPEFRTVFARPARKQSTLYDLGYAWYTVSLSWHGLDGNYSAATILDERARLKHRPASRSPLCAAMDRFQRLRTFLDSALLNPPAEPDAALLSRLQLKLERARPAFLDFLDTPRKDAKQREQLNKGACSDWRSRWAARCLVAGRS